MSGTSRDNFQPIHNPYVVGNPIKDRKMFFGREDDFTYIKQKVTGGKKGGLLVLCGTRRSGKTSILFQIMDRRLGEEFFPVLIDMQAMAVDNDLDFLIKLGQGIVKAIGDPGISLEEDFLAHRTEGSLAAFEKLIIKVNQSLGEKKLIILFDEYEIFEAHISKNLISTDILHLFANWIEHKEGVFIVFTGSDKLEERKAEYWVTFLGKALHRRISFLSKADTLRLIEEPLKDVIHYEPGVPEEIYRLTAGQPFFTQVFCQALVDHLNEVQAYDLTTEDLKDVTDQVIENPLPQMIFSWNSLGDLEKLALSIIGELNKESVGPVGAVDILSFAIRERVGYKIDANALNETLERLFHHDMLEKDSHGKYTFKMDLWRRWMARMHSIWQVVDEIKSGEGRLGEGISPVTRRPVRAVVISAVAGIVLVPLGLLALYTNFRSGNQDPVALTTRVDSTQLTIRTSPARADVFLDDVIIGRTPIENRMVAAGIRPLRIELPGYKHVLDEIDLRADEPFDTLITLMARTGDLELRTTPPGASISLNGEQTSYLTPRTLSDLPINQEYDVRMSLAGHNPAEIPNIQLYEDSLYRIHRRLSGATATVHVRSRPDGAAIYIDDEMLGETPRVCTLTHGVHQLELRKAGYQEAARDIRVPVPGDEIEVVLSKLPPGTLVVKVKPYAEIYVDGELKDSDDRYTDHNLEPGRYTVELVHPSYHPVTKVVQITSGETTELPYDFIAEGKLK